MPTDEESDDVNNIAIIAKMVGRRIVSYRERSGFTTTNQLAVAANLNYDSLRRWEAGQSLPNLIGLLRLTRAFKLRSVEELMAGSPYFDELGDVAARGTAELQSLDPPRERDGQS